MVWLGLLTEPEAKGSTVNGFRRVRRFTRAWSSSNFEPNSIDPTASHGTHRSTLSEQTSHELQQGPAVYQFLPTTGL